MEKTDYQGIDYGFGQTNRDMETGIRFGVIPHSHVGSVWYEDSEAEYGDPSCPECGGDVVKYEDDKHEHLNPDGYAYCEEFVCENCEKVWDYHSCYSEEPLSFWYNQDGYAIEQTDETDLFIFKSPFYTYAQFCSPCAPGACYLLSPLDHKPQSNKTYCLGPDWFESGKAPYPVYRI
jgi:hypothetical protein